MFGLFSRVVSFAGNNLTAVRRPHSADARGGSMPPMPVIVGAPRSGTTLLRLMLDAHPDLAIPPETGFLPALAEASVESPSSPAALARLMAHFPPDAPAWPDFGLDESALVAAIAALPEVTPAEAGRCFYRLYAKRFGKPRWGDKTPGYAFHMPAIQSLLPEAAFIHIIRDGRDAALSLRPLWFAPGQDIPALARHWRSFVLAARAGGAVCRCYIEVRYEDLVATPEAELRRVCAFLQLRWDPAMTTPHLRAPARLAEHQERRRTDGGLVVGREQRLEQQWRCATPPDPARVGVWREAMDDRMRTEFDAAAGDLLRVLGYAD
jgi:hypothetical protein